MKVGLSGYGARFRYKAPCTVCGAKYFTGGGAAKAAKEAGQFSRRHSSRDCPGRQP